MLSIIQDDWPSKIYFNEFLHSPVDVFAFAFRDIIQRVADVMKMYGFVHVAESFAVRPFFMLVALSKINLTCCSIC